MSRFLRHIFWILLLVLVAPLHAQTPSAGTPITADNAAQLVPTATAGADTGNIAVSPAGDLLALAGLRGVWLYDLREDAPPRLLTGHTGPVNSVAFSDDGRLLLSASDDDTARLWRLPEGVEVAVLAGHTDDVTDAVFAETEPLIATASASDDTTVRLWSLDTYEEVEVLNQAGVGHRELSFMGPLLFSATVDETFAIWNIVEDTYFGAFNDAVNGPLTAIASSPTAPLVALGVFSGRTILINVDPLNIQPVEYNESGVLDLAFSRGGSYLATVSGDNEVVVVEAATGEVILRIPQGARSFSLAFAGDDAVYTVDDEGTLSGYALPSGEPLYSRSLRPATIRQFAVDPTGRYVIAAGDDDYLLHVYDATTLEPVAALDDHDGRTFAVAFSADGARFASAGGDDVAIVWDTATLKPLHTLIREDDPGQNVFSVGFSLDGSEVATGYNDGQIIVWDAATGEQLRSSPGADQTVWRLVYSPDGSLIYVPGGALDAETLTLQTPLDTSSHTAVSPIGDFVTVGGALATPRLAPVDAPPATAPPGYEALSSATAGFNADGTLLVAGEDETLTILDVAQRRPVAQVMLPGANFRQVAFDGTDTAIYAGLSDGLLLRYEIDPEVALPADDTSADQAAPSDFQIAATDATAPIEGVTTPITAANVTALRPTVLQGSVGVTRQVIGFPADNRLALATTEGAFVIDPTAEATALRAFVPTSSEILRGAAAVAVDPTGTLLAVGHGVSDNENDVGAGITVWNLETETQLLELPLGSTPRGVAISPVASEVVVVDNAGGVTVYAIDGGATLLKVEQPHPAPALKVAYAPDGGLILSADAVGNQSIYTRSDGRLIGVRQGTTEPLQFSPDGTELYSITPGGIVVIDPQTGEEVRNSPFPSNVFGFVADLDVANGVMAVGDGRGYLILDTDTGEQIAGIGLEAGIPDGALTADGTGFVTIDSGQLQVWDVETGAVRGPGVAVIPGGNIAAVAVSSDGRYLALMDRPGATLNTPAAIRVWDTVAGEEQAVSLAEDEYANLLFLPGQPVLFIAKRATQGDSADVLLYDVAADAVLDAYTLDVTSGPVISPDGTLFAASRQERLYVQNLQTGEVLLNEPNAHTDFIVATAIHPGGQLVATGARDATLRLWDLATGEQVALVSATTDVRSIAFNADGAQVAVADADGVRLFDLDGTTFTERLALQADALENPRQVFFGTAGDVLLVRVPNNLLAFDVSSGELLHEAAVPNGRMSLSADGSTIAVAAQSGFGQVEVLRVEDVAVGASANAAAAPAIAPDQSYNSADLGLAFDFPAGWSIVEQGGGVFIVNYDYDNSGPNDPGEARIQFLTSGFFRQRGLPVVTTDPVAFLDSLRPVLSSDESTQDAAQAITLGGRDAAEAPGTFQGAQSIALAVGDGAGNLVFVTGEADAADFADFEPIFRAVAASVVYTVPTFDVLPVITAQNADALAPFRSYPAAGLPNGQTAQVAYNPDATAIAQVFGIRGVVFRDAETGEVLGIYDETVWQGVFTPDGTRFIGVGASAGLQAMTPTGEVVYTVEVDEDPYSIDISPDGAQLVLGGSRGLLALHDAATGAEIAPLVSASEERVRAVAFGPSGDVLAHGGDLDVLYLRTGDAFGEVQEIPLRDAPSEIRGAVLALAFSADGSRIAVLEAQGIYTVLDANTGEIVQQAELPEGGISRGDIALSNNGELVAMVGLSQQQVFVIDVATGEIRAQFGQGVAIAGLALHPDETQLLVGGDRSSLQAWAIAQP